MLRLGEIGESDCEALGQGLLAQPSLALTSLGYVVAALVVVRRLPEQDRGLGFAYAGLLALIGIGSVLFHGPQPPGSKFLHDVPIPALGLLIGYILLSRWRRKESMLPGLTRRKLATLLVVVLLALLSFTAGRTGSPLCDPDSIAQPHGLWHIWSAAAFAIGAALIFDRKGNKK